METVEGSRVRRVHWIARLVGAIGAWLIYRLIWLFGRSHAWRDVAWLEGPIGGTVIGDAPFRDVAAIQGLTVERGATDAGLVTSMALLHGPSFDLQDVQALTR